MPNRNKIVVYLGPEFTHSHEAAQKMFPGCHYVHQPTAEDVFSLVANEKADYGILPVQNSTTGVVHEFLSLLVNQPFALPAEMGQPRAYQGNVRIAKELFAPIKHYLLTRGDLPLTKIETIYTKHEVYLQCLRSLGRQVPDVPFVWTESSAAAADRLTADPAGACIGGESLAKHRKLSKRMMVHDNRKNVTRFVGVSAKHLGQPTGSNKVTFAITIPNRVGSLVLALRLVSDANVNISSLHMVPVLDDGPDIFKDWFVIDASPPEGTPEFDGLLNELVRGDHDLSVKLLGSYVSAWNDANGPQPKKPSPPPGPSDLGPQEFIEQLIAGGESDHVEFKSSLRYDHKTGVANKELPGAVAKTICGFLNSEGGYLFIGVSDKGEAIGIDNDLRTLNRQTNDGFQQALYGAISQLIHEFHDFAGQIHPEFIHLRGKTVCCIRVDAATKPAWMNVRDESVFFLRVGPSTNPQSARVASSYIGSHFKGR